MGKRVLTRANLLVEMPKLRHVRKKLRLRSNSEAVRKLVDQHIAAERGVQALRDLQKFGGLKDAFGRAPKRK
jgi:hypothetical protein